MIPVLAFRSSARLAAGAVMLAASLSMAPAVVDAATSTTIRISSSLSPTNLTVMPGTRVTWTNVDGERHRVRSRNGPSEFDSGNIEPGASWSVTLTTTGTYAYLDDRNRDDGAYHGTIVVAASRGGAAGPTEPPTGGGSTGDGSTTAPPTAATVSIGDRVFGPRTVTIAAGGSVTWRNSDDRGHTATGRGGSFDTGVLQPGASSRERFPTAGTYSYLCAIHPEMAGTIRVVAAGATSAPPAAAPKPTPRPTAPPSTTGSGSIGGAPTATALRIVDLAFTPATTSVAVGSTVSWTNGGAAVHTVTATDGSFDSGLIAAGASWSRTFDRAGTYRFVCAVHPVMSGSLIVSAPVTSPTSAPAAVIPAASAAPSSASDGGLEGAAAITSATTTTPPGPIDPGAVIRATLAILVSAVAIVSFARLIGGLARP